MTPEDLTPADREIAQLALLRVWLGRKKRAAWEIAHGQKTPVPVQRFDRHGRPLAPR